MHLKIEMFAGGFLLPSFPFRDDKMEKLESPFPCKRALSGGLPTARHCLTDERKGDEGGEMVRWKIEIHGTGKTKDNSRF